MVSQKCFPNFIVRCFSANLMHLIAYKINLSKDKLLYINWMICYEMHYRDPVKDQANT